MYLQIFDFEFCTFNAHHINISTIQYVFIALTLYVYELTFLSGVEGMSYHW